MKRIKDFFKEVSNKEFLIPILILMVGQSVTFYLFKLFLTNYHTVPIPLDGKIPFIPEFIYIYDLFYPFVFVGLYYVFLKDKKVYRNGVFSGIIAYLIADIIFIVYPTIMIRPDLTDVSMDSLTRLFMTVTYSGDNPASNCLPSIHCVFCFQVIWSILSCKDISCGKKVWITILALLISFSTLFVKQHYIYDVILAAIMVIIINITNF